MENKLQKSEILNIQITNATEKEILEYILFSVDNPHEKYYIVTPNPEIVMFSQAHFEYKLILNQARIAICDGIGLWYAAWFLGQPLKERVTGTDLMESICKNSVIKGKDSVRKPITVGFLGAGPGVALKAAECLSQKYPGLQVVFASEEWGAEGFVNEERCKMKDARCKNRIDAFLNPKSLPINQRHIDILFVAFGFPKQEQWMAKNLNNIRVTVMMGVGGAFDYISGTVPRAPKFLQSIGLEWLYRLIRQPWRLKRQLALMKFIGLVLREQLRNKG